MLIIWILLEFCIHLLTQEAIDSVPSGELWYTLMKLMDLDRTYLIHVLTRHWNFAKLQQFAANTYGLLMVAVFHSRWKLFLKPLCIVQWVCQSRRKIVIGKNMKSLRFLFLQISQGASWQLDLWDIWRQVVQGAGDGVDG